MRFALVIVAASLAAACGNQASLQAVPASPSAQRFPGPAKQLERIARTQAHLLGDRSVEHVLVARGSRAVMDAALGFGPEPRDHPGPTVWVIELHGHFVCGICSSPAGATIPPGTVADLVLSRQLHVTDFSFGRQRAELHRLGQVWTLPLSDRSPSAPG